MFRHPFRNSGFDSRTATEPRKVKPHNTYEDSPCQETKISSTLKKRTKRKSANKKQ